MSDRADNRASATNSAPLMNKISTHFHNAFRPVPKIEARTEQSVNETRKDIVRAHSHGNIRLQLGHWYTRGDVDGRRESFRGYSFVN